METSQRKGLNCFQVHLNPDSIRSLAHLSDVFVLSDSFASRQVANAMNATESVPSLKEC